MSKAVDFDRRYKGMQAEADDHYRILVKLQEYSSEFDKCLQIHYERKIEVELILGMSDNWQRFA